jgi:hypothetical protein
MTPDWLFQVMWFGAGVGGTGAIWYFLSERNYHAALWTGFATAVVFLLAVTLHIRNDLLRKEQQPATTNPSPAPERPTLENETPIATYPPASTAQDVAAEQILPAHTSDKVASALAPERPTIREKSAAEILANLKETKLLYQFDEKVKGLYRGRWAREPGWQAKVHELPSKLSGGYWHCSFNEVGSDTVIIASTLQDISMLRRGDSVTVSGRIRDILQINYISLEDAIIQGDNLPFP